MLGEKLMKLRKKQGFSQQEVADLLGCTRQTISNWECGQGAPALDKAAELAKLYRVGLADLVADEVEVMSAAEVSKKGSRVLSALVGTTCKLDFGDSFTDVELMLGQGVDANMLILDVSEDWLRVEYERSKGLKKKETVIQLIDVDTVNGFTIIGGQS